MAQPRLLTCLLLGVITITGCAGSRNDGPDLALLYNEAAQNIGDDRNPVIVIPGILGSKLESPDTSTPVWGSFTYGAADADTPEGARLIALPMRDGAPLSELTDDVVPTEVLDTLTLDIALIRGVELGAYIDILKTLAAGKYRDSTLGQAGAVDYGGLHYTCYQFAYDWRRDVAEQAALLHEQVLDAIASQPTPGSKVDIVAHSMGGMVLRYYLRYGPDPLPEDGSLPTLDWEGARFVDTAILIGTPSTGSVLAVQQLVEGVNFASLVTPTYRPCVLGTMPAIYQLMPRPRHARVVDRDTNAPIDLYDADEWQRLGWGLLDPAEARVLKTVLPDIDDADARLAVARDHLEKSLARAKQLHRALDLPATPPDELSMHLVLGDAIQTPDVLSVNTQTGRLKVAARAPGDDTVTRSAALADERVGRGYAPRLRTSARFDSVLFLTSNHLGLTKDPLFANYVLYQLLERPRD